jgi:hypothetical protein
MRRKSRRWANNEDPLSLLGDAVFWMVGIDEMMCSGVIEGWLRQWWWFGTSFVWELRKLLTKILPSAGKKDTGKCVEGKRKSTMMSRRWKSSFLPNNGTARDLLQCNCRCYLCDANDRENDVPGGPQPPVTNIPLWPDNWQASTSNCICLYTQYILYILYMIYKVAQSLSAPLTKIVFRHLILVHGADKYWATFSIIYRIYCSIRSCEN